MFLFLHSDSSNCSCLIMQFNKLLCSPSVKGFCRNIFLCSVNTCNIVCRLHCLWFFMMEYLYDFYNGSYAGRFGPLQKCQSLFLIEIGEALLFVLALAVAYTQEHVTLPLMLVFWEQEGRKATSLKATENNYKKSTNSVIACAFPPFRVLPHTLYP